MKDFIDSSIESKVINLLMSGPIRTTKIVEKIQEMRTLTPKQSVYLALRELKKKEIVVISGKIVSLNQLWISRMKNLFDEAYVKSSDAKEDNVLLLQEKEYINYKFNSLISLQIFWEHLYQLFLKNSKNNMALCYHPHEWFLISRKESELNLLEESEKRKISLFELVAGKQPLDLVIKKYYDGEISQIDFIGKNVYPHNYYIECFDDYVIEVWLDERTVDEIEKIYQIYSVVNEEVIDLFQSIIKETGYNHKMKISRNHKKALKLKNLLNKYFFIK